MREQGYGRIVMTTSSSACMATSARANYGAAKMALVGLMQTLAIEGEKYSVRGQLPGPDGGHRHDRGRAVRGKPRRRLNPALVSPGLLALVRDDAPTRAILCAGAGHFADGATSP